MGENYREQLQAEYAMAVTEFEKARANAIEALMKLDVNRAVEYGAGYVSGIDKVSAAAMKVQVLGQQVRVWEHIEGHQHGRTEKMA